MRIPIVMPQLGESIAEATILTLLIAPGATIRQGEDLFEVETDKAVMTVTSPCSGTLEDIVAETGIPYPVGSTLAYVEASEEDVIKAGFDPAQKGRPTPDPKPEPHPLDDDHEEKEDPTLHFAIDKDQVLTSKTFKVEPVVGGLPVPASASGAGYISPRLRARMQELGMNAADLAGVAGTGAAGRVTVTDFESFMQGLDSHRQTHASPMRIAVADSMRRSWTRPLATVGIDIVLDPLLAHRSKQNPKPGITLYAMRALAIALSENTAPAGLLIGNRIIHPKAIDIGFAVEAADGVLVPVIRDVEQFKLASLVERYNELIELSRKRRLPREAAGSGIATVTNFGAFGILWATPIPLPEQNLVLGLGAGRKVPHWSKEVGQFIPVTTAGLTLSFDHRVLDGGGAGRLLERVTHLLQNPELL